MAATIITRTSANKSPREEDDRAPADGPRPTYVVKKKIASLPLTFSLSSPVATLPRPSSAVTSRLPAAGSRGGYFVLIRGELSGRFKLYDPAIKIVLTDNYI